MIIKKAVEDETQIILDFYHELIDLMKDKEFRPSWTIGIYPTFEDIDSAVRHGEMYVAEEGTRIIGAFIINHRQGEGYDRAEWIVNVPDEQVAVVHLLAAHPEMHGKGIGTALLNKAVEIGRATGDKVIRLDTLPRNKAGRMLYENFGFKFCGEVEMGYPTTGIVSFCTYEIKL